MGWEYWRLAWRPVVTVTVAGCVLAGVYRLALEPLGERRDAHAFLGLFVTVLLVYVLTLLTCRAEGLVLGFERRLYRLPVSTFGLVLGRLLPALLTASVMYLATVAFVGFVFGSRWPILGPTLVMVTVTAWTLALSWSLGTRPYLLAPVGLPLAFVLLGWLKPWLKPRDVPVMAHWAGFGTFEVALLLLASALGVAVATVGVRLDRAESRPTTGLLVGSERLWQKAATEPGSEARVARRNLFRDARHAQLWMEWREKGRYVPLLTLFSFGTGLLAGSFPSYETGSLLRTSLVYLALAIFMAPIATGMLHGRFDQSMSEAGLDRLRATRPVSDRDLALLLFRAALRSVAASWAVALVAVVLVVGLLRLWGDGERVALVVQGIAEALRHTTSFDLLLLAAVLVGWALAACGCVLSAALSGRNWVLNVFSIAPLASIALLFVAERITGWSAWRGAMPMAVAFVAALLPVALAVSSWICLRERVWSVRTLARGALALLFFSVLLLVRFPALRDAMAPGISSIERLPLFLVPAALCGVFLPFVLAPLMVTWNRHR